MDPITLLAAALGGALGQVANHLIDKGIQEPLLEPATDQLKGWVQRGHKAKRKDQALLGAVQVALKQAGAPTDDDDQVTRWLKGVGLDRLAAEQNAALRRQVAQAVLAFTDPAADPPEDLLVALGWPRSQKRALSVLLSTLRGQLAGLDDWQPLIAYADQAGELGLLRGVLEGLARLDRVFVLTEAGAALRVAVIQAGLSEKEAADAETRYRQDLVQELRWHDFRGIVQIKRDMRLPLADIYQELSLLPVGGEQERRELQEQLMVLREKDRLSEEERRLDRRVTDALSAAPRLVVLGEPGSGKTMTLRFVALMLATGCGAARLGLDGPYIPLMVRLADYARALQADPALSLCNYLLDYVERAYDAPHLSDLLRLALERGACLVLLDGMDEVGDDPLRGRALRGEVVGKVQQFADRWCEGQRCNRVIVTSRIEGYWDDPVRGFEHAQLSPLRPPDEIEAFLLRWYAAHELGYAADATEAEGRARERVGELLPHVLQWPSVRRLATNPLLLTILALIHENVGRLPNRRIRLYEICAQTLIESWRQAQTGQHSALLAELGEETVIRVMAPLAYWLHETHPGGTASYEEWRMRLVHELEQELGDDDAGALAERFLYHARHQAGLLAERGLGQYGFFHLTFEEYLAARELARQRVEDRRARLLAHWEDPRWHEVILLTAGQLGIVEARRHDVSDLVEDLLKMEPQDPADEGHQAVLAGRALADIDPRSVTNQTRRWVMDALEQAMRDLDPDTGRPNEPPRVPVRTRYEAGEALDDLGWLPGDLDAWVYCPGCARDGGDLLVGKYPVTNAQYARFVDAGGYREPRWWSEAGWQWRTNPPSYRGDGPVSEPGHWSSPRLGRERRGSPVVGVSWYEAEAYCNWLADQLRAVEQVPVWRGGRPGTRETRDLAVRLPEEQEWVAFAGGIQDKGCYPWDPPAGPATTDEEAIRTRANTSEAGLSGPSPVAMYPLGASQSYGLIDLAGNVWEWTASEYEGYRGSRVLRGGSWANERDVAVCAARHDDDPYYSVDNLGFRCVSPISPSGS